LTAPTLASRVLGLPYSVLSGCQAKRNACIHAAGQHVAVAAALLAAEQCSQLQAVPEALANQEAGRPPARIRPCGTGVLAVAHAGFFEVLRT